MGQNLGFRFENTIQSHPLALLCASMKVMKEIPAGADLLAITSQWNALPELDAVTIIP
jgi:hypothetical protein